MAIMQYGNEYLASRTITSLAVSKSWHLRHTDRPYYPTYRNANNEAVSPAFHPHCQMFETEEQCMNYIAAHATEMFAQAKSVGLTVQS